MAKRYTHSARLNYAGILDDVFDRQPRERFSTCSGGPISLYGKFKGTNLKVNCCLDGTY